MLQRSITIFSSIFQSLKDHKKYVALITTLILLTFIVGYHCLPKEVDDVNVIDDTVYFETIYKSATYTEFISSCYADYKITPYNTKSEVVNRQATLTRIVFDDTSYTAECIRSVKGDSMLYWEFNLYKEGVLIKSYA